MSAFNTFLIDATVKAVILLAILMTGGPAYGTWLERRFIARIQVRVGPNRAGPFGLLQPIADAIKLVFKEDLVPAQADKVIFTIAPAIMAIPTLILIAVVPWGDEVTVFGHTTSLGLADVNVGILWILAIASIAVYGVVLAGWASANKYAILGALRSSAQMISYELAMGLSMLGPVMLVGSLSIGDIIEAQDGLWFVFIQPVAAIIFIITALAETARTPFDLPEAEQELTAGFHTEYSGMKWAAFMIGEYVKMIAVSVIAAALFFGGYRFFGLEAALGGWGGPIILGIKVVFSMMTMIWIRATIPRLRYDRLMAFGWKVLMPVALLNVLVTAILIVLGVFPTFG